jgi:[calcium/calmodulin-dependent protein kinase] kinase
MITDFKNRVTVRTAFENIEREIAMMKRLRHPNLVQLFEVIDSVESDKLYMVLEYVSLGEILSHVEGTDMYKRTRYKNRVKGLTPGGYFDETNAALYFVDIMHGLAYLHR